jgi:lysine 6-dehydrogenase
MKKKIIVLGAGLVGGAMAIDLRKQYDVSCVDIDSTTLKPLAEKHGIHTMQKDLSDKTALQDCIKGFDLVVSAVPGFMGFKTLQYLIEAGKDVVDIAFMPEDFLQLDGLAKKHNVTVVADCGVAPGMGNIILGYHNKRMQIESYECLVGGLPVVREWPYEYKAVFSPIDVIEEYIRPSRYIQNNKLVVREALSDAELIHFENVGTLESWNSDGLRSLATTMNIPNMIEKTLRYPGTIEYLQVLRKSGFFSYDEVDVKGHKMRPIDLTAKLLFDMWKLKPGEEDFTVMRIVIIGNENGNDRIYIYDLYDRYSKETNTISMARTTGYTCTAVASMVADGLFVRKGVNAPEFVGVQENHFNYVLNYLKERNVIYKLTVK